MKCPRCGADMSGGICKECGFPMGTDMMKPKYRIKKIKKSK